MRLTSIAYCTSIYNSAYASNFYTYFILSAWPVGLYMTTIEGNGAEFFDPPNFNRPFRKRISALPYIYS
jgi:hypothetical protein